MKNFLILISFVTATTALLTSCVNNELIQGKGESISKIITIDKPFNKVISDVGYDLEINPTNANNTSVEVIAQQNLIDLLSFAVADSELVIKMKRDVNIVTSKNRRVIINVPNLQSLKVLGDGNATIKEGLITNKLKLSVMGNAGINSKQATIGVLECGVSGNGNLNFEECTTQDASYALTGNGQINAFGNLSRNVKATVTGNGNIDANIAGNLDAIVTGNGSINYKGNATITREVISGNGSIDKK